MNEKGFRMHETMNHDRLRKQKLKVVVEGNTTKFVDDNDNVITSKTVVKEEDKVTITKHNGEVKVYPIPNKAMILQRRALKKVDMGHGGKFIDTFINPVHMQVTSWAQISTIYSIDNKDCGTSICVNGCCIEISSLIRSIFRKNYETRFDFVKAKLNVYKVTSDYGNAFLSLQMAITELDDVEKHDDQISEQIIVNHLKTFGKVESSNVPNVYFNKTYRNVNIAIQNAKRDIELYIGVDNTYVAMHDKSLLKHICKAIKEAKLATGISKIIIPASLKQYQESFRNI